MSAGVHAGHARSPLRGVTRPGGQSRIISSKGLLKKSLPDFRERSPQGQVATCLYKSNPPYPPLTGGQERAKPRRGGSKKKRSLPPTGGNNKKTPLTRGGRGGCFCPLTRGVGELIAATEGAFASLIMAFSPGPLSRAPSSPSPTAPRGAIFGTTDIERGRARDSRRTISIAAGTSRLRSSSNRAPSSPRHPGSSGLP